MKRIIFTLSVIIAAGLITTAYSQVSIRANINLGRIGVSVRQAPVVYEPACTPPPPPCYDNGYNKGRIDVVIGARGRDDRYYDHDKDIRFNDRNREYRDRNYRDRDRRDNDRDHGYDGRTKR